MEVERHPVHGLKLLGSAFKPLHITAFGLRIKSQTLIKRLLAFAFAFPLAFRKCQQAGQNLWVHFCDRAANDTAIRELLFYFFTPFYRRMRLQCAAI